jgi:hypothetical protein
MQYICAFENKTVFKDIFTIIVNGKTRYHKFN